MSDKKEKIVKENTQAKTQSNPDFSTKSVTFVDPYCTGSSCDTILFLLPQVKDNEKVNGAIDSSAIAVWVNFSGTLQEFSSRIFDNWHEVLLEYQEETEDRLGNQLNTKQLLTKGTVVFNQNGLLTIRYDLENRYNQQLVRYECGFLNLDLSTLKPLTIFDLLKPNSAEHFISVAEYMFYSKYKFRLNAELEGCKLRMDRCRFILPEYFSISESALILEYKPNELGPAWLNNAPIVIPYDKIQELIDPKGPLAWAITNTEPAKRFGRK